MTKTEFLYIVRTDLMHLLVEWLEGLRSNRFKGRWRVGGYQLPDYEAYCIIMAQFTERLDEQGVSVYALGDIFRVWKPETGDRLSEDGRWSCLSSAVNFPDRQSATIAAIRPAK